MIQCRWIPRNPEILAYIPHISRGIAHGAVVVGMLDLQIAADIANSYVRNFIRSDADRRVATTASARQLLSDRVNSAKAALETSERALVAYAEREGIVQVNPVNTGQGAESSADGSLDCPLCNQLQYSAHSRHEMPNTGRIPASGLFAGSV